eukprot:8631656-Pyramimonas_sp.AAC.1
MLKQAVQTFPLNTKFPQWLDAATTKENNQRRGNDVNTLHVALEAFANDQSEETFGTVEAAVGAVGLAGLPEPTLELVKGFVRGAFAFRSTSSRASWSIAWRAAPSTLPRGLARALARTRPLT